MEKMEWRKATGPFASGEILYLGKWPVGFAAYDGGRSRDDPKKHSAKSRLPGIKELLDYY